MYDKKIARQELLYIFFTGGLGHVAIGRLGLVHEVFVVVMVIFVGKDL